MGKIIVVGIGPGEEKQMTLQARDALKMADVIVGYTKYVSLLGPEFDKKEILSTGMRQEVERCRLCFEKALAGKCVALVCSGDAGVYGMASLIYELSCEHEKVEIEVIAGVTAALSGAAILGAPVNHDFCTISLSDQLTPWEIIEKRLIAAAQSDFVMALYNPASNSRPDHLKRACQILEQQLDKNHPCGYVKNIGRQGVESWVGTLEELQKQQVDMFCTCFIGNSQSYILDGKLITPRGYKI